jgi:perosamine synthetase
LLGQEEVQAAGEAILSGWVTQGPRVAQFEKEFAKFVGAQHAVAVSSCTAGLHLALKGAGVGEGDDVLVPSYSFIATANSILYCRARPIFVDISSDGFNLDPSLLEVAWTPKTKAILVVHQVGMPCDLKSILKFAARKGVKVVEDAACAIGSEVNLGACWEKIGKPHGHSACFSFHPRKVLTTGDGGMITTNDTQLDQRLRLWRHHGMSVSDVARHRNQEIIFEDYTDVGYNYRMTDIQGAIGSVQLTRLSGILKERRSLARLYEQLLADVDGLLVPHEPSWARTNWQTFLVSLTDDRVDQRAVMQQLRDAGISTRRGIMCAHREPAYRDVAWGCSGPNGCDCGRSHCAQLLFSERAQQRSIALPLFPGMSREDVHYVVKTLCKTVSTIQTEVTK